MPLQQQLKLREVAFVELSRQHCTTLAPHHERVEVASRVLLTGYTPQVGPYPLYAIVVFRHDHTLWIERDIGRQAARAETTSDDSSRSSVARAEAFVFHYHLLR